MRNPGNRSLMFRPNMSCISREIFYRFSWQKNRLIRIFDLSFWFLIERFLEILVVRCLETGVPNRPSVDINNTENMPVFETYRPIKTVRNGI